MSETEKDWCSRTNHRGHTPGAPRDPIINHYMQFPSREMQKYNNRLPFCAWMDKAWTVMLCKQGLVKKETAAKLFPVLAEAEKEHGWGGEDWIKAKLDGDEYTASAVNFGRTLQEPMWRMQMRAALLDVFDELFDALESVLDKSEQNADVMMAGQSHFSHAQPTTYGAYLLAVHDGMSRALAQLELAYRFLNMNSGGCGACSGTGWPVDRELVTELLGFDETIECTYDCEGSQDEIPQILFALSSLALTVERSAMDHGIWSLEEINNVELTPGWLGISSFMPQKAHSGGHFENVRSGANDVIGQMMTAVITFKNESIQDNLPVYRSPGYVTAGCCHAIKMLGMWANILKNTVVNRERMLEIARQGYSGAPDLAIKMIRGQDYAGRQAHRICCNFVRLARERGIKPYETTGELLDEAARITGDPEPHLSTEDVQDAMNLETFFEKHNNLGDPCPSETLRMLKLRSADLEAARQRQAERRRRIEDARAKLQAEMDAIVG